MSRREKTNRLGVATVVARGERWAGLLEISGRISSGLVSGGSEEKRRYSVKTLLGKNEFAQGTLQTWGSGDIYQDISF